MSDRDKPDKLAGYRQKRDPGRTNEPFAPEPLPSAKGGRERSGASWGGAFVVHEHDASRKHYDLRLEVGGVLKSFAVPQGPSLDPEKKRLAVQTEDHPFEYLEFEGVIPDHNYGAGPMIAWDLGRVRFLEQAAEEGLAKGKLDFELSGYKLRGRFALVLTSGRKPGDNPKQKQWLLLKKRDAHARPGTDVVQALPESVLSGLRVSELEKARERATEFESELREQGVKEHALRSQGLVPMACALDGAPLESPDYLYELKLDGVRIVAEKQGDEVALYYRKGRGATVSYPDVVRAMRALPFEHLILDGEIITIDETGRPNFQRLAQRFQATRPRDVERVMRAVPVSFVAFDLLALGPFDLTRLPLHERKAWLKRILPARGVLSRLDHIEGDGRALHEFCRAQRLEGLVAKRANSPYRMGPKPSSDWVKIKADREDDFVVVGYTRGNVGRELGALDLASYQGDQLVSRGKVGSGFDGSTLKMLLTELEPRRAKNVDVLGDLSVAPRGRTFVRPELVVNVRYTGFTEDGHLRHPVYRGLRADVAPRECTAGPHLPLERFEPASLEASEEDPRSTPEPSDPRPASPRPPKTSERRVVISNAKKVFWPAEGYTKGDLCGYYEAMAPVILPLLRERPVILVRYPDGIEGKSFYQWNAPHGTPSWVRTIKVRWEDRNNKEVELFLIDDLPTLLHIANLGCIPLHILAARLGTLSTSDFFTIDFDLGGQPLAHGITLARELKSLLDQVGLCGYPKTSGQTGLHVLVPLGPAIGFDTARALCELLGTLVANKHREIATVERNKARRGPRVYVDTGQTGTLRAIVAPYSVRAYPGARVSTPLTWDEVSFALDPARFNIFTVPERVREVGDPLADFLRQKPDIPAVVQALQARFSR